jgi:hypothetical protein
MSGIIAPAFQAYPAEGAAIGRLLCYYGELEFRLALCVGQAIGSTIGGLRAIFRLRSESSRLQVADAVARTPFADVGLQNDFADALGAIRHCLKIRNQFAHCHWGQSKGGLRFISLQDEADRAEGFAGLDWGEWSYSGAALLAEQEAYFAYTYNQFEFITAEFQVRRGQRQPHDVPKPTRPQPPNLHMPTD